MITMLDSSVRHGQHSERIFKILFNGAMFSTCAWNGRAWKLECPYPAPGGDVAMLHCFCKDEHAIRKQIAEANAQFDLVDAG